MADLGIVHEPIPAGADHATVEVAASRRHLALWAQRLATLSEEVPQAAYRRLVPVLGDRRPYKFERNGVRWGDGLFHLVDRSYREIKGIALSEAALVETGVAAWHRSEWCSAACEDGAFMLMDDEFSEKASPDAMMRLAKLMARVTNSIKLAEAVPA